MVTTLLALTAFFLLAKRATTLHNHITEHLNRISAHLERRIDMSTQDTINAVVAQLGKAKGEIVTKIADVQAQLDAASIPAEVVDLTALTEAAQALDDVVADVPVVPSDVPVDAPADAEPPTT